MEGEHKSYGYEGGYEDWTADKVVKNMRIMQDGKQVADVEETESFGKDEGINSYTRVENKEKEEGDVRWQ